MRVAEAVERLDGLDSLGGIEARLGLGEGVEAHEEAHHVAARHVVHHEVDVLLRLEAKVPAHPSTGGDPARPSGQGQGGGWWPWGASGRWVALDEGVGSMPRAARTV